MGLLEWIQQFFDRDDDFLDLPEEDSTESPEEDFPPPPSEEDSKIPPELYSGMRVEVTTP